jgi:hypothetical protein
LPGLHVLTQIWEVCLRLFDDPPCSRSVCGLPAMQWPKDCVRAHLLGRRNQTRTGSRWPLESMGLARRACNVVSVLYESSQAVIALGGGRHGVFAMTTGIWQGCPLSPLPIAACTDELLRQLVAREGTEAFAFADETAVAVEDWAVSGPRFSLCSSTTSISVAWQSSGPKPLIFHSTKVP